jgi:DNA-directed RNA polymerase subunit RPC12/RpoP
MGLHACEDCGNQVSDAAVACPACGRPSDDVMAENTCDRCGQHTLVKGTGLHGPLEVITAVLWSIGGCLLIGIGFFFYGSSRQWCTSCRRRPRSAGLSPAFLIFLIVVGLWASWWAIALATGTAQ